MIKPILIHFVISYTFVKKIHIQSSCNSKPSLRQLASILYYIVIPVIVKRPEFSVIQVFFTFMLVSEASVNVESDDDEFITMFEVGDEMSKI